MSISDTQSAKKYASIAEVAAAQAKSYAIELEKSPDYANQALQSAEMASASADSAMGYAATAASSASSASSSSASAAGFAQTAGDAAEAAISQTIRAPEGESLSPLPATSARVNSFIVTGASGDIDVVDRNTIPSLDSAGKIPVSMIPSIALTQPFVVSSQAAMLALTAQPGDIAKRTDLGYSFCLASSPATTLTNWVQLTDDVLSILGMGSGAASIGAVSADASNSTVQAELNKKAEAAILATSAGAAAIGFKYPATGSKTRTVEQASSDEVNAINWLTPDSTADQTAAMAQAIAAAAGRTLKLPKGTFIASLGTLTSSITIVGEGSSNTIIKRPPSSSTGILTLSGSSSYSIRGICFDGNKDSNTASANNIEVATSVVNLNFENCRSTAAKGGSALVVGNNNSQKLNFGTKRIVGCRLDSCDAYGCILTQASSVVFECNECDSNALGGFASSWNVYPPVAASQTKVFIKENQFHDNGSVGCFIIGFIEGGKATAPLYGSATNANYRFFVSNNYVGYNKSHGLVVQANEFCVEGNICEYNGDYTSSLASAFSGLLVNGAYGVVNGNFITGNSGFGIDMGGSKFCTVNNNTITENATGNGGGSIGLNLGGCQYVTASSNLCSLNGNDAYGVQIMVPGFDGGSTSFQTLTTAVHLVGNTCVISSTRIGIKFYGRPLQCSMSGNRVTGGFVNNAYIVQTNESVSSSGNLFDSPMPSLDNQAGLVVPDDGETFLINGGASITNLVTYSSLTYIGKCSEAYVTSQGSGYDPLNPPVVTISGGGGSGAAALAAVDGAGRVISVTITSPGSGYTSVPAMTIAPPASGTTATAIARVGVVNFTGRKLTLYFNTASTLQSVNNIYLPSTPLSVPAKGVVKLLGTADGQFVLSGKSF